MGSHMLLLLISLTSCRKRRVVNQVAVEKRRYLTNLLFSCTHGCSQTA